MAANISNFIDTISNFNTNIRRSVSKTSVLCRVVGQVGESQMVKVNLYSTARSRSATEDSQKSFLDLLGIIDELKTFLVKTRAESRQNKGEVQQASQSSNESRDRQLEQQLKEAQHINDKRQDYDQIKKENARLSQQLKESKAKCDQLTGYDQLKASHADLQLRYGTLEIELTELKGKGAGQIPSKYVNSTETADEIKKLQTMLNDKGNENDALFQANRQLEDDMNKLEKNQTDIEDERNSLLEEKLKRESGNIVKPEDVHVRENTNLLSNSDTNDALEKERATLKNKCTHLEHELGETRNVTNKLRNTIKELETKIEYFESEKSEQQTQYRKEMNHHEEEKRALRKRMDRHKETRMDLVDQIKDSIEPGMVKDNVIQALLDKNSENIDRLAAEMNAKIASDESALENISIQCRPMNIADQYNLLCSNAWLDAKQALDDAQLPEQIACEFLTHVLQVAHEEATNLFNWILDSICVTIKNHQLMDTKPQSNVRGRTNLPNGIITQVGDYLRSISADANLDSLESSVTKRLDKKHSTHTNVKIYIAESTKLAWKMVIQRPPMSFTMPGKGEAWQGDTVSDLFWGSDPYAKGAVVRYYVNPILNHGDKSMAKGKVMVK